MKRIRLLLCILFCFVYAFSAERVSAQIILTPQSMGLGGGGTAYLTGPEALFVNPANLRIQENSYRVRLSLINSGIYFDELFPASYDLERFTRFFEINQLQSVDIDQRNLTSDISDKLIEGNFGERQQLKTVTHQADLLWLGLKWVRPNRSYAIAARSRFANKFKVGRGLFTTSSFNDDSSISRNQYFSHTTHVLHEVSFGFGESFTYLNGQYPGLSEFIVGIAPKIVIPGSYQYIEYDRNFRLEPASGSWQSEVVFSQTSAGLFTDNSESFFSSPDESFGRLSPPQFSDILKPQGFGFGLDAGITYLVTFGDDLSLLRDSENPTKKSLRLSLSVTDLGFVVYQSDALQYNSKVESIERQESPPVSGFIYEGIPDEHYLFLSQFSDFENLSISKQKKSDYKINLPTSMQAGATFQYNRFKAVTDISYSMMKSAFNTPGLAMYTGIELRPLPSLPLRAGTRVAKDVPGTISFGAGIETMFIHLNASVTIRNRGTGFDNELLAMSAAALTFYF